MKKYISKFVVFIIILVFVDFAIQLVISKFFMDYKFTLIKNILYFNPIRLYANKKNIGMFGNSIPSLNTILIGSLVYIGISVFFGLYFTYLLRKSKVLTLYYLYLSFMIAPFFCQIINFTYWKGWVNYIGFFKLMGSIQDIYVFMIYLMLLIFIICYVKYRLKKLSKDERKQQNLIRWIKKGCPLKRTT